MSFSTVQGGFILSVGDSRLMFNGGIKMYYLLLFASVTCCLTKKLPMCENLRFFAHGTARILCIFFNNIIQKSVNVILYHYFKLRM